MKDACYGLGKTSEEGVKRSKERVKNVVSGTG